MFFVRFADSTIHVHKLNWSEYGPGNFQGKAKQYLFFGALQFGENTHDVKAAHVVGVS